MQKAIYKITNNTNHKVYIGQSKDPSRRFREHCEKKENYKSLIGDAINKYGRNNFSFEILGWYENYNEMEQYYISQYRSLAPYGYNILPGGQDPPHRSGENNSFAKLSLETVNKVKKDLQNWNIQLKAIVKKYKLTYDMVRHINQGESWHDDALTYPLRPTERELNERRADKVIELLKTTNLSQKEIGQMVGWNRSAVTMINNGHNHKRDNLTYPIRK